MNRPHSENEWLNGNCCGCSRFPRVLFKLPGADRYRCDECFVKEMGFRHPLAELLDKRREAP